MPKTSTLDAVKIQSRALIPVVKAFETELGKEKAHIIAGKAIADSFAHFMSSRVKERNIHPGELDDDSDNPVVVDIIENTDEVYAYNVTKCGYAEYFCKKGEPEIGYLLTCGTDFAMNDILRPDWEFQRTQTLMEGAPYCDFRYKLKDK